MVISNLIHKRARSMRSGYSLYWSASALKELEATFEYLLEYWTERELNNLALRIEGLLLLISKNPNLFPRSEVQKNIRRAVVTKHNTLYYRFNEDRIEIISFYSNHQNPRKV